ncbi:MAG: pilus assembly protein PilM [Actinomycetota bacterium]|nr:pilus assembly protein PilM [Actinomycetota bacterium]
MAIGLDIGSSAVRAVQLEQGRGRRLELGRYREAALPSGAVVDGEVVEPDAVSGVLRELWREAKLRPRTVAVGLASQRVTVRQLDLPDLPDDELADAVRLQAQDQLPIPIDQALLDYVVVDRYDVGEERSNVRVLLVAAEQEMVERMLLAVTSAGLRPALVDLDPFALLRSLVPPGGDGNGLPPGGRVELLVDVGAMVTKIAVHRGGDPLFVRMVRLGGATATRELQRVLELSWDEAERAKLEASAAMAAGTELDPDDERASVLRNAVQRVITEIGHSLDFFRRQHDDLEVQRVLLCGGGSLAPNLADQLEAVLDVRIEQGNPLQMIGGFEQPPENGLKDKAPFLAVPVGLAMGLLK